MYRWANLLYVQIYFQEKPFCMPNSWFVWHGNINENTMNKSLKRIKIDYCNQFFMHKLIHRNKIRKSKNKFIVIIIIIIFIYLSLYSIITCSSLIKNIYIIALYHSNVKWFFSHYYFSNCIAAFIINSIFISVATITSAKFTRISFIKKNLLI